MTPKGRPRGADHFLNAEKARLTPRYWLKAGVYASTETAGGIARAVRSGGLNAYAPAGQFQSHVTRVEDGAAVWVRYVDLPEAAPAMPATMTVRIRHDGDGPGHEGVGIITVTVDSQCPRCHAPRGADTIRPHHFRHDGDRYEVDVWDNPCQHVDLPPDVLAEARNRDAMQSHVELPEPVRLILQACGERTIHSGKQAAQLLGDRGFNDEAALIRAEVKQCNGLMSAKQAAGYLRNLTAAATQHNTPRKDTDA
ncbi:hypothetical protein [Streptomyces sp. SAI-127]|uniref:hypothetical protein n=1 Tax=Streptomyces sp. SAI-127 TaxID=2940543 RepID=UPI0024762C57|nr:hypothetical protein [Streptomyces sp. SAI-127]MDH6489574.1 hypothetical protein [Streptomyces sp. SAI-127]